VSVVGIDYGTRRIGIAVSSSYELATPHSVIPNPGQDELVAEKVTSIGQELGAELYVLGVPRGNRTDGERIEARFSRLADLIRQKSCTEVLLWDESHTTVEAAALRHDRGRKKRRGRDAIDHEAAAVMLQSWLDQRRKS
jgi:putative Holliday junction resolvase